jgi:hypothetical protein
MQCVEQAVTDVCAGCVEDAETRTTQTQKNTKTQRSLIHATKTQNSCIQANTHTHTLHTHQPVHTYTAHTTQVRMDAGERASIQST